MADSHGSERASCGLPSQEPVYWSSPSAYGYQSRENQMNLTQAQVDKKPKRAKPFAASLASRKALEADGWTVTVVEQRIPKCFITRDAYGFGDLLCCSPTRGIMLVQATGGCVSSNFNARIRKIKAEPRHAIWLASGGRIQVHSHEKAKGTSKRVCRILEITKDPQL